MELGTIIEHDFRVKVSDMSDTELHQEIAGQWFATRDFDEDQMNIMMKELVRRGRTVDKIAVEREIERLTAARKEKEWVGLTHREMQELMSIRFIDDAVLATEAKLKEKNS